MRITELFSRRQKRARGEFPDVYQYETIPKELRVQIVHIMMDVGGRPGETGNSTAGLLYQTHAALTREYGLFHLLENERENGEVAGTINFFLSTPNTERALDVIETFFRLAEREATRRSSDDLMGGCMLVSAAIRELNARFREHGVGYSYEARKIVKVESQLLHAEVVRPALALLHDPDYRNAETEFLSAHEHYRHGRYPESINDSLKAFESVMKIICSKRRWAYQQTDTANRLIETCLQNGLVPAALLSQFTSLRAALESGVPTVRNRFSGHGGGTQAIDIPESLASYVLHLTGTNILFLVNAEKELP